MTDAQIKARRNSAQLLGTAVFMMAIRALIARGLLSEADVDLVTDTIGPELWNGLLVVVGATAYSLVARLARFVSPVGRWLEGHPAQPTYNQD